jgi:hypothetical protein
VLRSITYGNDEYVFTDAVDQPDIPGQTDTDVTGPTPTHVVNGRYVRVDMKTNALTPSQTEGAKLPFKVTINGTDSAHTKFAATMGADETSVYRFYGARGTKYTFRVYKGGALVSTFTLAK